MSAPKQSVLDPERRIPFEMLVADLVACIAPAFDENFLRPHYSEEALCSMRCTIKDLCRYLREMQVPIQPI